MLLSFVACGGGDEKVLTILYWQAPSLPGPYLSSGFKDRDAGAITLEPLAHYGPDGALVPALAEEIPTVANGGVSADLRSITWSLREGLKWSDGSEMTADDVVFTWRYCTDEATGCTAADVFAGVASVTALDSRTVRISFEGPTPYPYQAFVSASSPVISRAQFQDCVGAAARACVDENTSRWGPGPYRIVSFAPDREAVYERNPHYRGEKPYFDRLILKGGGDAVAAARAVLERAEADYAWNLQVDPDLLAELEANGHGVVVTAFTDRVERIVLNQTNPDPALGDDRSEYLDGGNPHPFLSFHPIRQAISMAIDRSRIAELYGFAGQPACDLVAGPPHYVSGANDDCLIQDIAGANRLLDEHGVLDSDGDGVREHNGVPLRVTYMTSTNAIRQATQELVRDWWREIGIETALIDHDASVYFGGDPIEDRETSYTGASLPTCRCSPPAAGSSRRTRSRTAVAARSRAVTTTGPQAISPVLATRSTTPLSKHCFRCRSARSASGWSSGSTTSSSAATSRSRSSAEAASRPTSTRSRESATTPGTASSGTSPSGGVELRVPAAPPGEHVALAG